MKTRFQYICKHFMGVITASSKEDAADKIKKHHLTNKNHPVIYDKNRKDCNLKCNLKIK